MRKTFVLDTNVILHNPNSLVSFADNTVLLPIEVLEELDRFKRNHDEKGRNARIAIRMLDSFREKGEPGEGFPLENGGILKISVGDGRDKNVFLGLSESLVDNKILLAAYARKEKGEAVIFVSKDINARIKANALGIISVDFEKQKVDFERLYSGCRVLEVTDKEIDAFFEKKEHPVKKENFHANEFAVLVDKNEPKHTAIARYKEDFGILMPLIFNKMNVMSIRPRNREQAMAIELLLNNDIHLVTLVGPAGTGKTLLAIAAGLQKVVKDKSYAGLLISRPVMPLGKDIGYLPGTKEEKLENWMGPIFDNLEYILHAEKKDKEVKGKSKAQVEKYIDDEILELEAMTFMRGRSIPDRFIIIDEAQNMTPHEVKTVISRAGNHTKMVLTGDPYQIDNPYLDSSSNGLTYCVEKMKGQKMFGHMTLMKSERSSLAALAAKLL
ncbi:MAG: PhoH family protein [Candidatus Omnitrophota bacterium]|nr:PhoH family protein [Candidatus Omnitrophota bacterium]MBU1894577.1 PhoH family protein [Candidatus Omnitrophota bacterium]